MTTMEFDAYRAELAREILNTDSRELLDAVRRTIKRITKNKVKEEELPPYSLEEMKGWIKESLNDISSNRVYTLEEIEAEDLNEMPWFTK